MSKQRKRYRYIGNSGAKPSDPISNFRLIGGNQLKSLDCRFADVIRIEIPDDMVLEKYSCDGYSTTDDKRTLEELSYNVVVRFKNGIVRKPEFENRKPDESILGDVSTRMEADGYHLTNDGYLNKEEYKAYLDTISEKAEAREKKAEELKEQLDNKECSVSDLEYVDKDVLLRVLDMYVRNTRKLKTIKADSVKALVELSFNVDEANKAVETYLGEVPVEKKIEYLKKTFDVEIFSTNNGNDPETDYRVMLQAIIDKKWRT